MCRKHETRFLAWPEVRPAMYDGYITPEEAASYYRFYRALRYGSVLRRIGRCQRKEILVDRGQRGDFTAGEIRFLLIKLSLVRA